MKKYIAASGLFTIMLVSFPLYLSAQTGEREESRNTESQEQCQDLRENRAKYEKEYERLTEIKQSATPEYEESTTLSPEQKERLEFLKARLNACY